MAAALTLAEAGADVVLCEALTYPGGCASTFSRQGWRFEAGATLFSGFGEGQLFRRWIDAHGMDVSVDFLDPVVTLRSPALTLPIPARREVLVESFCALPGAPEAGVRAFFDEQRRVADALWALFDDPDLLPPFGVPALLTHLGRAPRYLPVLRLVGRPLLAALRRHGLADFAPLRCYLDAVCQITVQASSAEAEAPFAMGAMDYYFRGTGHVRGGIGRLAEGMVDAIEGLGGRVMLANRVKSMRREGGAWCVETRKGVIRAERVVANVLPQGVRGLLGVDVGDNRQLDDLARRVEDGWGAAMLYLGLDPRADLPEHAHHLELVVDSDAPFIEGNHLFCSVSAAHERDRGPDGGRTATVSTHLPMKTLNAMTPPERAAYVAGIQRRMWAGIEALAPRLAAATVRTMPASPRTFERFTRRPSGFVGGIPRRAGLTNYQRLWPAPPVSGLYLVGDSTFPGQSTLAVALGGLKVAQRIT